MEGIQHGMEGIQHGMEKRRTDDIKKRLSLKALAREGEMQKKMNLNEENHWRMISENRRSRRHIR
jgi:hypothetical protein